MFCWVTWCWSPGAKILAMIKKRPASLSWNVLWNQSTEKLCSRAGQGCSPFWQSELVCVRVTWVALVWKPEGVMESSLGLALWEDRKGHWRRHSLCGSWGCKTEWGQAKKSRLGTIKRTCEKLLMKVQTRCRRTFQCYGDASAMEWSTRTVVAVEWSHLELKGELHVLQLSKPEKWPKPFGRIQKIVSGSQILDSWNFVIAQDIRDARFLG